MKVKELIKNLKGCNPNAEVLYPNDIDHSLEAVCIEKMKELINSIMIDTDLNREYRTPYEKGMRSAATEMEWIIKDYKRLKKKLQDKT